MGCQRAHPDVLHAHQRHLRTAGFSFRCPRLRDKSGPPEVLVSAIRSMSAGRPTLCPEISQAIATSRLLDEASATDALRNASSKFCE
jgi:DNA-binding NarL/FixJ family response regulator